jgi:hypothetical protein
MLRLRMPSSNNVETVFVQQEQHGAPVDVLKQNLRYSVPHYEEAQCEETA